MVRLIAEDYSFTSAAYIHNTLVSIMWYGSCDIQSYCAPITALNIIKCIYKELNAYKILRV